MSEQQPPQADSRPSSDGFGRIPNDSESFRTVRKDSEAFGRVPHAAERKQNHTLTVREAARLFETAGVARTERSIVNWCQPNKLGVPRLDCYFDPNERKYFITPQSVDLAIAEEKAKAAKGGVSEPVGTVPNNTEEDAGHAGSGSEGGSDRAVELEKEVLDLKILNGGKDFLIQQLRQERDTFFTQLLDASHKVGELETRLLQLEGPKAEGDGSEHPTALT